MAESSARRSSLGFESVRSCGRIVPRLVFLEPHEADEGVADDRPPAFREGLPVRPESRTLLLLERARGQPVGERLRRAGVRVFAVLLRIRDADDVLRALGRRAGPAAPARSGRRAARRPSRARAPGSRGAKSESSETVAIPWRGILRPSCRAERGTPCPARRTARYTELRVISLARAIEGFDAYVADERRFSPRTVEAYRADLERFAGFWESEFANLPPRRRRFRRSTRSPCAPTSRTSTATGSRTVRSRGISRRSAPSSGGPAARGTSRRTRRAGCPRLGCPRTLPRAMTLGTPSGCSRRRRGRGLRSRARARALRAPLRDRPARLGGRGPRSRGRGFFLASRCA